MVGVCTLVLIINPFETVLLLQDYFLASIINSHLSHASHLSMCRLFKGRKGNDAQNSSFLIKLKCGMDFSSLFFLDVFSLFFLRGGGQKNSFVSLVLFQQIGVISICLCYFFCFTLTEDFTYWLHIQLIPNVLKYFIYNVFYWSRYPKPLLAVTDILFNV